MTYGLFSLGQFLVVNGSEWLDGDGGIQTLRQSIFL